MLISFEGIGGCGKSTQALLLFEYIKKKGKDVILTREPGGSPGAEEIRRLILEGVSNRWSPKTEILLFNAARRDHLERVIWPALKAGGIVITDRYVDSTRVYQGAARAELRSLVDDLHQLVCVQEADLTIVISISAEEGMRRVAKAKRDHQDRFDDMPYDFQQALFVGYEALIKEFPSRCVKVDGVGSKDDVFVRVCDVVLSRLGL